MHSSPILRTRSNLSSTDKLQTKEGSTAEGVITLRSAVHRGASKCSRATTSMQWSNVPLDPVQQVAQRLNAQLLPGGSGPTGGCAFPRLCSRLATGFSGRSDASVPHNDIGRASKVLARTPHHQSVKGTVSAGTSCAERKACGSVLARPLSENADGHQDHARVCHVTHEYARAREERSCQRSSPGDGSLSARMARGACYIHPQAKCASSRRFRATITPAALDNLRSCPLAPRSPLRRAGLPAPVDIRDGSMLLLSSGGAGATQPRPRRVRGTPREDASTEWDSGSREPHDEAEGSTSPVRVAPAMFRWKC